MSIPDEATRIKAVHHVVHDYANLVSSGMLTQAGPAQMAGIRPPVNSHIQHAFLLNCRKMAGFFKNDPKRNDDIVANHFTSTSETFNLNEWDNWGRALDKQLAHLTYTRVTAPVPWDGYIVNNLLLNELQADWKYFLTRLHNSFKQVFDEEIAKKKQPYPNGDESEFKDLDLR
jgi:hypothetical protein